MAIEISSMAPAADRIPIIRIIQMSNEGPNLSAIVSQEERHQINRGVVSFAPANGILISEITRNIHFPIREELRITITAMMNRTHPIIKVTYIVFP
jgi:hypothetical protein